MRLNKTHKKAFIRAVMQDVPRIKYEEQIRSEILGAARKYLPEKVQEIWDDKELRGYIKCDDYLWFNGIRVDIPCSQDKFSSEERARFEELSSCLANQRDELRTLERKLESSIEGITSLAALKAALPEMEKYMPAEEKKTKQLPSLTGVVTDFMQAGWPDDKKKAAKG